jgi:hypothetical protein
VVSKFTCFSPNNVPSKVGYPVGYIKSNIREDFCTKFGPVQNLGHVSVCFAQQRMPANYIALPCLNQA